MHQWYERTYPLGANGTIDHASIASPTNSTHATYYTNPGKSITHLINGAAGNIESHSYLDVGEEWADLTAFLDDKHYGFGKLSVVSERELRWQYVRGDDGSVEDALTLLKR